MSPNDDSQQNVSQDKNSLYSGANISAAKSINTGGASNDPSNPGARGQLSSLNIGSSKLVDVASDRPISDLSNLTMSNTNAKDSLGSGKKPNTSKRPNWIVMGSMIGASLAILAVLTYGSLAIYHHSRPKTPANLLSQLAPSKQININVPVSANQSSVLFDQTNLKSINLNGDVTATGNVTALSFSGNGSNLTNLNASNLTTGTVNNARLSPLVTLLGNSIPLSNIQSNILASLNGVVNNGGNINIVGDEHITVTPNPTGDSIQLGLTGLSGSGTITSVNAGSGLTGGGSSGNVTLSIDNTVTTQGNTFNGSSQLVQLTAGGALPTLNASNLVSLNASNISSGTLSDSRLDPSVTLQGNTFNGNSQLVQLDNSGDLPALNGGNLTNLNASNITAGTLNDLRLSPNVTLQGNSFNNANQLVQLTSLGYLPVINGSNLTNLNGSSITSGTVADARLSANVALQNANNVFSGNNTFSSVINTNNIQPDGSTLTIGASSQALSLQGNASTTLVANNGANSTTVSFSGTPTGSVTYNFNAAAAPGTYTICTTVGNCSSSGGGVTSSGGTANQIAVFTGTGNIANSTISDTGSLVTVANNALFQAPSNSTTAFQIQNSAGTSNLFDADTTDSRIGIGTNTPGYTLDVNGPVNATALYINGTQVCSQTGCTAAPGTGTITGVTAGTGLTGGGSSGNVTLSVDNTVTTQGNTFNGNSQLVQLTSGGLLPILNGSNLTALNASSISSGTLSNSRLSASVTLQGNTFNGNSQLVQLTSGGILPVLNGSNLNTLNASNISSGTVADARLSSNVALKGSANTFTANNTFTGGTVLDQNSSDSTTAFQIQNSAGTSNLFDADTTDSRIGIGTNTPGYTLDVNGDINSATGLYVGGVLVCTSSGCSGSPGSGTITGVTAGTGLTGGGSSGNVTLSVDNTVTTQGNTFNGNSQLVQLTSGGVLPALNGGNLTSLNGSNISSGTVADARLSTNVTLQGNTFNSANELVQLNGSGFLPALNGSNLTNLNASNISSGTIADARLSSNVPLLNANNNFSGNNTFGSVITNTIQPNGSTLTIGASSQSLSLQGTSSSTLTVTNSTHTTKVGFSGTPTGNVVYNFDTSVTPGTYTICTTYGNCSSSGGGVTTTGGTANQLAKFNGSQVIANSTISDTGSLVTVANNALFQPTSDSTTAFQIQNSAGTSNLFDADTTNTRVGIATNAPGYTLDVNGDINSATGLYVNGVLVCSASGCSGSPGSGTITGVTAGTGLTGGGTSGTVTVSVDSTVTTQGNTFNGNSQLVQLTSGGLLPILNGSNLTNLNGSSIASGTVADARLSTNVTLQGNTFNGNSQLVQLTSGGLLPVLNGSNLTTLNGSNISSGTVADARLSTDVTLQGNTFNGASQLVQLTSGGILPVLDGSNLTNLNASNISSGTLANARLTANVTLQGNTFNGASQLVQLTAGGILPVLNGSNLTNLNGSNISSGTVADARLSTNVTLQGNTFNGASELLQLTAGGILPVLNGSNLTTLNGSNISSGTVADARLSTNVALLNANNNFTGNDTFTGTVLDQNATNSTTTFQIQNAAGSTTVFDADTTDKRIGVDTTTPGYALDVNGDINVSAGSVFRINGQPICGTSANCAPSQYSNFYIWNSTALQGGGNNGSSGANFNFQSASSSSIGGIIEGASGQTAALLQLQDGTGSPVATFASNGALTLANLGTANNSSFLCRNTINVISLCSSTGSGAVFVQGGNSFGATAVLGTQDNNSLQLITNNTAVATFDTSGDLYLGNGATAATPNNSSVKATGSSTAGTAGANLTINGGAGATTTTGSVGGNVNINGGNAGGSGNNAGGNISIDAGTSSGIGSNGTVSVGGANASSVTLGNSSGTVLIQGNTTSSAVSIQAASGGTLNVGSANNVNLNLGTGAVAGAINVGGTTETGQLTVGQSTQTNIISIGSAAVASGKTQTINVGTGGVSGSTTTINIGSAIAGVTTLQSAGGVAVNTLGPANTATYLCRNSSNLISACTTATGAAFIQGGNSFGSTAILGTIDNYSLQILTSNTTRAVFDNSGYNLYLGGGALTVSSPNNFSITAVGSSTAGTAGANLTINGGAGATTTTGSAGGNLNLNGGNAGGSGNNVGGNVSIDAGIKTGTQTNGTVTIGGTNASLTTIGNASGTVVIQGNTTVSAVSIQSASGGSINIGTANNNILSLGTAVTTGSISLGGSGTTGSITLGQGTTGNVINIGASIGNGQTQTINLGNSTTSGSVTALTIGDLQSSSTTAIQGGTSGISIKTGNNASGTAGSITIDTGTSSSGNGLVNIGGTNASTINIGHQTGTAPSSITIGSTTSGGTNTVESGVTSVSVTNSGVTIGNSSTGSTSAFQVQTAGANPISLFNVDNSTTGNNLISSPNSNFEVGSPSWVQLGTATLTQPFAATTAIPAYEGSNMLKFVTSAINSGAELTSPTLTGAHTYSLSLYLKAASGDTGSVNIGWSATTGNGTCYATAQTISSNGWTQYSCSFTVPSGTVTSSYIYAQDTVSGDTVYMDAVQLIDTTSGNTASAFNVGGQTSINGLVNTPLTLQNAGNSTTDFLINNAVGTTLLAADTTNMQIVIGNSGNTVTLSSAGITLAGNARHPKTIVLGAEYAGAVLDGTQIGSFDSGSDIGTMNAGWDSPNSQGYYQWTTGNSATESYDVDVTIQLPSDFAAFASSNPLTVNTNITDSYWPTTDNSGVIGYLKDITQSSGSWDSNWSYTGSGCPLNNTQTSGHSGNWYTEGCSLSPSGYTYHANDILELRLRVSSDWAHGQASAPSIELGNITLSYSSSY